MNNKLITTLSLLVTLISLVNVRFVFSQQETTQLSVTYNSNNLFIYIEPPEGKPLALGDLEVIGVKQDGNRVTLQVGDAYDYQIINEITKPTCLVFRIQNIPASLVGSPEGCTPQNASYSKEISPINVPWRDSIMGIEFGVVTFRFGSQEKRCELAALPCSLTFDVPLVTPTPTNTPTLTPSPTETSTPTPTPSPTETQSPTPVPSSLETSSDPDTVTLWVTYNANNLFIYVEPRSGEKLALGDLEIIGVRRGDILVPLRPYHVYSVQVINEITEPTCFVLSREGGSANLVGSPDKCTDENAKYNESPISSQNTAWIEFVSNQASPLGVITLDLWDQRLQCDLTPPTCELVFTPTPSPTETQSPTPTPTPEGMIFLEALNIFIDTEMVIGSEWKRELPAKEYWHQRVQEGEVDDFGFNYGDLPDQQLPLSNRVPNKPLVDEALNWFVADAFCHAQGKHLPTLEELERAETHDEFVVYPELIEWTNTPYLEEGNNPDKPRFYELWVQSDAAYPDLQFWTNSDGPGYHYPVYSDTQTIKIGFRCVQDI